MKRRSTAMFASSSLPSFRRSDVGGNVSRKRKTHATLMGSQARPSGGAGEVACPTLDWPPETFCLSKGVRARTSGGDVRGPAWLRLGFAHPHSVYGLSSSLVPGRRLLVATRAITRVGPAAEKDETARLHDGDRRRRHAAR